ncbi:hypothetical protein BH10BAC4_BH10BAC4_14430 [soil metagenome]
MMPQTISMTEEPSEQRTERLKIWRESLAEMTESDTVAMFQKEIQIEEGKDYNSETNPFLHSLRKTNVVLARFNSLNEKRPKVEKWKDFTKALRQDLRNEILQLH